MSYSSRNRPKLSDRYRGKSGDEILNELKSQIDEDRKMFFESNPGWNSVQSPGSSSRAGHPLDDMMSRGRQDIRSHLDDLAHRHPEFADHLRCPPWGGEIGTSHGTWGRKRRGSGSSGDTIAGQEPSSQGPQHSEEASPSRGRSRENNLPQYGLRNTVDLGQQQQEQQVEDQEKGRGQRSWSAPPDNRTQNPPDPPRFVSRLDIPVNPIQASSGVDQGKPPVAPKLQQTSASKQTQQGSNVRHIPIFVEGRDEPLLSKTDAPTDKIFMESVSPNPTPFSYNRPSQFNSRQSQQQYTPNTQQSASSPTAPPPKAKTSAQHHVSPPYHPPPSQQRQECSQQKGQSQSSSVPQPSKHPLANDTISRVQVIQKDVDELKSKVESYTGNSRKDKDYMYLDEMLTRNLLKLDNIETEGKEDLRQARKAVIRNIQQCISILESKVPNPEEICEGSAEYLEKSTNELCEKQSSGSDYQEPIVPPKTDASCNDSVSQNVLPEESCGPEMDVETSSQVELNKSEHVSVNNPVVELPMETELIDQKEANSAQGKSQAIEQSVINCQTSSSSEVLQTPNEQFNSCCGTSENAAQSEMQMAETVNVEHLQEEMKLNSSANEETVPIPAEKDENDDKTAILSPKEMGGNGSNRNKSPKRSPKKGIHAS